ncbi:hypothetical protein HQ865_01210 [Mucilaginibacter mali]|uniref:Uncharacterized protein n=1 Tax=Mucilaginibacter mali TaxID=2740462 RepID=A0A7D4TK12_9SPHI|nr:hypothetical protein [Mucilaginibacter mali]QKJ28433.1 hypothetical protein HQ865_01210 [Mucilaginibacter mali]
MRNGLMSPAELAQAADGLTYNFGGNDEFLEFTGDGFADAISKGSVYNLRVTNADTTNKRTMLFCPGLIVNAAGLMTEGAFNDTAGGSGLSAAGTPFSLAYFNALVQRAPIMILGFKIATTNAVQLDEIMTITKDSPFKQNESRLINPGVYASEANPNGQLITVPSAFQLDFQTKISYGIQPSTTVNFIFVIGPSLNNATALTNKVNNIAAGQVAKNFIG